MTIGEVARRSGFTVKALRYYERCGLLSPSGRRPSGYRVYGEAELHRLEFIQQAKALALTLEAIRELVAASGAPNGLLPPCRACRFHSALNARHQADGAHGHHSPPPARGSRTRESL